MKFDQDLCLNLQYDFGKMNSNLGSVVPLAMFCLKLVCDVTSEIDHDLRSLMTKSVWMKTKKKRGKISMKEKGASIENINWVFSCCFWIMLINVNPKLLPSHAPIECINRLSSWTSGPTIIQRDSSRDQNDIYIIIQIYWKVYTITIIWRLGVRTTVGFLLSMVGGYCTWWK